MLIFRRDASNASTEPSASSGRSRGGSPRRVSSELRPVATPTDTAPTWFAIRISSAGSSPTTTISRAALLARPMPESAAKKPSREGLPKILGRLPVSARIIELIAKLVPIPLPSLVAKKGTWLAVTARAPAQMSCTAASRSVKANSRCQPV